MLNTVSGRLTSIYISNLSEDVWPFISSLKPAARKIEVKENALLSDRDLLSCWVNQTQIVILPTPVDPDFISYLTDTLGPHQIKVLVPRHHSGQVCLDIMRDASILTFLQSFKQISLSSYAASPQFYQLVDHLRTTLKLQVTIPEAPKPTDSWTVDDFGSKSGLRRLVQTQPDPKKLLAMSPGATWHNIATASQKAARIFHQHRGVVLKTSKGHAGMGVLIFRSGELPDDIAQCQKQIAHQLRSEKYWTRFPIVVERLLDIDLQTGGGNPSVEVRVGLAGRVHLLYQCGMRVTTQGVFKGIEIHRQILPPTLTRQINQIGRFLGTQYASRGYRGYFDVDLAIDTQQKLYITESNVRRTGGTHVYLVAKHLFGRGFDSQTYTLSNNLYTYPSGDSLTFDQLRQKLKPVLFTPGKKAGLILAAASLLQQRRMAYIIFGPDKPQALKLEAQMEELLSSRV